MADLVFLYSAMNGGKSTVLLQTAHNYEERFLKPLIVKSSIDTKGNDKIVSRVSDNLGRNADVILKEKEKLSDKVDITDYDVILVDEAQFLSKNQIEELWYISKLYDLNVICYGLKTDFKTNSFPGSLRLFELADQIKELDNIPLCECGEKARFNARMKGNQYILQGKQNVIDNSNDVSYNPLCGKCYIKKVLKYGRKDI